MNGQRTAASRNRALIRTWHIVGRLEAPRHDATLRQLAAETEYSTRTIRSDLAAIAAAGFPLVTDTEEPGRTSLAH
jgi:predicted DNA-binding transcriptional regulator YafY